MVRSAREKIKSVKREDTKEQTSRLKAAKARQTSNTPFEIKQ